MAQGMLENINPLTAFYCCRYFVLRTNSIFMCANGVLLSEHYYHIYVTAPQIEVGKIKLRYGSELNAFVKLSFGFHTVQLFLILHSVLSNDKWISG